MRLMIPSRFAALAVPALATLMIVAARGQVSFGTLTSAHFDVKYQQGVTNADARKVNDFLLSEYKTMSGDLGLNLTSKIEVRVYESVGKFLSETALKRPWRAAYYSRGTLHVQPVSALTARKIFEKALTYELAVALLEQSHQKGCPRWLYESFAAYYSGETAGMTPPLGARLAAFSDLNQDIQEYPNPPQRDDVHFILAGTMTFLVEKYGERRAFRIFKEFDGATPVDKVFKKTFGDDYAAIEKMWAKYIFSRTATFK